jgi:hypothetical protein
LISLAFSFRPATIGLFSSSVGYVTRLVHVLMAIPGFVTMMMERLMKSLTNTNPGIVDLHCAHAVPSGLDSVNLDLIGCITIPLTHRHPDDRA